MDHPQTALKPNVLIAPLDWGLGHATRCIPIIRALLHHNCRVLVAGEGKIRSLLEEEFPGLPILPLEGYRVHYSKNRRSLPFTIAAQIPRILSSIKKENAWLPAVVKEYSIDAVISDNRYGLHHHSVPSVFITHQLRIRTPFGKTADDYLQRLSYRYIGRFRECWVPDSADENNLSGGLSHPLQLPPVPVKYLGPLSRFTEAGAEKTKHLLILLSGPEPQRTLLEHTLLQQLDAYTGPVVLVRGLPGSHEQISTPPHITVHNHLPATVLQQKISEASFVISRCGYSTVMDMAAMQKKSILIPTPGQTEQEYLAKHLMEKKRALCIEQKTFNLPAALQSAAAFDFRLPHSNDSTQLYETIGQFAERLRSKKINPAHPSKNPAHPPS